LNQRSYTDFQSLGLASHSLFAGSTWRLFTIDEQDGNPALLSHNNKTPSNISQKYWNIGSGQSTWMLSLHLAFTSGEHHDGT